MLGSWLADRCTGRKSSRPVRKVDRAKPLRYRAFLLGSSGTLVSESVVFGTVMSARKSSLTLPLPLQFLAAWIGVWLERAFKATTGVGKVDLREGLGGLLIFYYRGAA
jgi:hypothetical protein